MAARYEPYPVSVQLLQTHKFCTFKQFQSFISNYQYSYIMHINRVNRASVKQSFQNLRMQAPFSRTTRFPANYYIDMDCEKIRTVTTQFLNALFRLDLWEEKEVNGICADSIEYINRVADAKMPCDEAFTKFADIIMSTDIKDFEENGIYCRQSFEKKYGLIWCPNAV